jgi:alkaline phosphatase
MSKVFKNNNKWGIMMKTLLITMILSLFFTSGSFAFNSYGKFPYKHKRVKNVIIMIADGGGFNQYLASNYYRYDEKFDTPLLDLFPTKLAMSTYSAGQTKGVIDSSVIYERNNWSNPVKFQYGATDSAAAATAMSTGIKTYDAGIGIASDNKPLRHMIQDFEAMGRATGVVTSVPFSHATPAGFVAHNADRNDYFGIADEMIKSSATDVIMGCGNPLYDDEHVARTTAKYKYITADTWNGLVNKTLGVGDANGDGVPDPWTLIQTKAEFEALLTARKIPNRLIGIPQVATTLQEYRNLAKGAELAYKYPLLEGLPTLQTMAEGAIRILSKDKDGFFLMIEGGAVDWAGHFGQPGRLIEEMDDFQDTIEAVYKWVERNSNWNETLLIVTADHETGFLSGSPQIPAINPPAAGTKPDPADPTQWPTPVLTPVMSNGIGVDPTMYYQTNILDPLYKGMYWHSNQLVPFYAKGAGSYFIYKNLANQFDPIRGYYIDNTEISVAIRELLFK